MLYLGSQRFHCGIEILSPHAFTGLSKSKQTSCRGSKVREMTALLQHCIHLDLAKGSHKWKAYSNEHEIVRMQTSGVCKSSSQMSTLTGPPGDSFRWKLICPAKVWELLIGHGSQSLEC